MLAFIGVVTWWLSGYDSNLSGDNARKDQIRRGIRCGFTFFLLLILLALPGKITSLPIVFGVVALLALTWAWCIAELFSHGFQVFTGATGTTREFDPHESVRNMERVAELLRHGQREEALELAETLKASDGANILALETLLERAGIPQESSQKLPPLAEAHRFHVEGKFDDAEAILKSLLAENPSNVDAALMLMRIYAQDFRRSDKAMEVLRRLEKQPHISNSHIEYASRSIQEWGRKKVAPAAEILPESPEELVAAGYLGTAIEMVERAAADEPGNFDAQLKVAEIYALRAGDIHRTEKIVKKIGENPAFSAEQIEIAQTRLREWSVSIRR